MTYAINPSTKSLAEWVKYCNDDINNVEYRFHEPAQSATTFYSGKDEMLRVASDGFYVRGVRIEQDDREAEVVYNAFKQWLAWANLQQGR